MSVRYDFQCDKNHEFVIWSDDARLCPVCGSEYLKRIFVTPTSVNSGKSAAVDALVKREFDMRGITNIHSEGREGDVAKVNYKSTPADLAAQKVNREFPQLNDPQGLQKAQRAMVDRYNAIGVKGVIQSGLPGNDVLRSALPVGTRVVNGKNMVFPSAEPNAFKRNDSKMVQRAFRRDPENLQVKK